MNFTNIEFWQSLLLIGLPFVIVRFCIRKLNYWPKQGDALGLLMLSLYLFWLMSRVSFSIFMVELVINFAALQAIQKCSSWGKYIFAGLAIALNLSVLGYFKYSSFIFGVKTNNQVIPPGISFYIFQLIGLIVDSFRGHISERIQAINYANFVSFFPQIVAGPIERWSFLSPQLQLYQLSFKNLELGIRWIVLGLFVKLVIAENLATYTRFSVANTGNAWEVWLWASLFGLQLYFDFAGYSFIALGLAKSLGINLTVNFLAPYTATDIQDFWRRWNVSLMEWFRDYIYFPLGGSRVPWTAFNILIVFIISGIWHGAGWNFVLWGLYHGIILNAQRYLAPKLKMSKNFGWLLTVISVMFGWIFFAESNLMRLKAEVLAIFNPVAYGFDQKR